MTTIISRIRKTGGRLVRVHPNGREEVMTKRPIRPMTDAEVEAAALSDADARPLTDEEWARAKPLPRTDRRAEDAGDTWQVERIKEGLSDVREGRVEPAEAVFARIGARHGWRR
jgi:putative transcriptional regulator